MEKIAIVGGGIAGIASAILLNESYKIDIFEKRSSLLEEEDNKSYNLTISPRGMNIINKLGLKKEVLKKSVPLVSRVIFNSPDSYEQQFYNNKNSSYLFSISRKDLLSILMNKLTRCSNVKIHLGCKIIDVDKINNKLVLFQNRKSITTNSFRFIIGADGVFSRIRNVILQSIESNFSMKTSAWVYKKFTIQPTELRNETFMNSIIMWNHNKGLCVGIPNIDKTISMIFSSKMSNTLNDNEIEPRLEHEKLFNKNFELFSEAFDKFKKYRNEVSSLHINEFQEVQLSTWYYSDKVVLIGDAAHSIIPFYGQGMNFALEDVDVLVNYLSVNKNEIRIAFKMYQNEQKKAAIALSQLCYGHLDNLKRNLSGLSYNLSKLCNELVQYIFPDYKSEYVLVSDGDLKYDEALKIIKARKFIYYLSGFFVYKYILIPVLIIKNIFNNILISIFQRR